MYCRLETDTSDDQPIKPEPTTGVVCWNCEAIDCEWCPPEHEEEDTCCDPYDNSCEEPCSDRLYEDYRDTRDEIARGER